MTCYKFATDTNVVCQLLCLLDNLTTDFSGYVWSSSLYFERLDCNRCMHTCSCTRTQTLPAANEPCMCMHSHKKSWKQWETYSKCKKLWYFFTKNESLVFTTPRRSSNNVNPLRAPDILIQWRASDLHKVTQQVSSLTRDLKLVFPKQSLLFFPLVHSGPQLRKAPNKSQLNLTFP